MRGYSYQKADRLKETAARLRRAEARSRRERWAHPARAKVTHPKYGEIIVPHASKLSAIMCAAEAWGCDWGTVIDAEVKGV